VEHAAACGLHADAGVARDRRLADVELIGAGGVDRRSLMERLRYADTNEMDVFSRTHVGSRAPRLAGDEPLAAIFAGTPDQVAGYLAERMLTQPETLNALAAELTHLSNVGRASDSLTLMLRDARRVTVRP
jgi:hypothetical protein